MFKSFWKGCQSLLEKSLGANTHFRSPKCDKNNFKNQKVPILIQPLFKKALHFFPSVRQQSSTTHCLLQKKRGHPAWVRPHRHACIIFSYPLFSVCLVVWGFFLLCGHVADLLLVCFQARQKQNELSHMENTNHRAVVSVQYKCSSTNCFSSSSMQSAYLRLCG